MKAKKEIMIGFVSLLFIELLAVAIINTSFCNGSIYVGCIQSEREALLRFKQDLNDSSNRLSSWVGDGDCCKWAGVVCNNLTGHVIELHLGNPFSNYSSKAEFQAYERSMMRGKINPSLLDLKLLVYLDLSYNYFEGVQVPKYLGSMRNLRHLNLSSSQFQGMVPHQLGNLSCIQYLDLSRNDMLYANSLSWVSGLSSLKQLDLSSLNLSVASDWLLQINKLSSLTVLQLSNSGLHHIPPLPFANFSSSLTTLDLSDNLFDNSLETSWVSGLHNLKFLDMSGTNFHGPIPDGIQNLTSLQHLDLSFNYFNSFIPNWLSRLESLTFLELGFNFNLQGPIPRSWERLCTLKSISLSRSKLNQDISEILEIFSRCIFDELEDLYLWDCQLFGQLAHDKLGQAKNLRVLDISYNVISGYVPSSLGQLSSLRMLDISYNKLNGTLSQIYFANLTKLTFYYASENSLTIKVNFDWLPPFQLKSFFMTSCYLGPQFPSWLHSQKKLSYMDISNSGIVDSIPNWFWRSLSQFDFLNLSHNRIQGEISNLTSVPRLVYLDLGSNNISGPLPLVSPHVYTIDLSNNAFSGPISQFLCHKISKPRKTQILKLGNNSLSGELPNCWKNWKDLLVLELSNNKFTGNLPFSIGNLSALQSLHLRYNRFFGVIPSSLKNCTKLVALDIGENELSGNIPSWMGESLSELVILNLRSNKFYGFVPDELCRLSSLQILDLAYNNLSGYLPKCVNNFSSMVAMNYSKGNNIQFVAKTVGDFVEDALLVMKGKIAIYKSILNLVRSIDLSKNNFSGKIPEQVTGLHALRSLNLSHNSLTGKIPETIGDMREIESMDLSTNHLSSEIPQSITSLTFLAQLDLSNNKLTGGIPLGTQLQSFNASSFTGNELCGSPLKNCTVSPVLTPSHENGGQEVEWFYVSMALGFVVGFWSLISPLLINRRWRYMYCCFLDKLGDKFYFAFKKFC